MQAPRIETVRTYPNTADDIVIMEWEIAFKPTDVSNVTPAKVLPSSSQGVPEHIKLTQPRDDVRSTAKVPNEPEDRPRDQGRKRVGVPLPAMAYEDDRSLPLSYQLHLGADPDPARGHLLRRKDADPAQAHHHVPAHSTRQALLPGQASVRQVPPLSLPALVSFDLNLGDAEQTTS